MRVQFSNPVGKSAAIFNPACQQLKRGTMTSVLDAGLYTHVILTQIEVPCSSKDPFHDFCYYKADYVDRAASTWMSLRAPVCHVFGNDDYFNANSREICLNLLHYYDSERTVEERDFAFRKLSELSSESFSGVPTTSYSTQYDAGQYLQVAGTVYEVICVKLVVTTISIVEQYLLQDEAGAFVVTTGAGLQNAVVMQGGKINEICRVS